MNASELSILQKFINSLAKDDDEVPSIKESEYVKDPSGYIEKLKKRMSQMLDNPSFKEGDIVVWKDGLKNKRLPEYGELSIVLKKFDVPLSDPDEITDSEELDIQLGLISDNDEFLTFNYDSKRFELFQEVGVKK